MPFDILAQTGTVSEHELMVGQSNEKEISHGRVSWQTD